MPVDNLNGVLNDIIANYQVKNELIIATTPFARSSIPKPTAAQRIVLPPCFNFSGLPPEVIIKNAPQSTIAITTGTASWVTALIALSARSFKVETAKGLGSSLLPPTHIGEGSYSPVVMRPKLDPGITLEKGSLLSMRKLAPDRGVDRVPLCANTVAIKKVSM